MSSKFFEERQDQSEVKARIVNKYFLTWAKIVLPTVKSRGGKIAYIDLYAGPGRYKDGSASTPIMVLESAISDKDLSAHLVTLLNDGNKNLTDTLKEEVSKLPGIKNLLNPPDIRCGEVDGDAAEFFSKTSIIPSFTFVDPFGYKGLSLKIVNGVIKDWGCDCVFFFNYNRINPGLSNQKVDSHMNALFGVEQAENLRKSLIDKSPAQREALILEGLAQALKSMGGTYVLPFRFKNAAGTRTSHSLIFVSKHFKGYEVMKDIMAKESSVLDEGIPSFTYSPAEASTPLLFSLNRPKEALEADLLGTFAGQSLSLNEIYQRHSVDTPYLKKHYKEILLKLEAAERVETEPKKRRKGTLADHVTVKFPGGNHG